MTNFFYKSIEYGLEGILSDLANLSKRVCNVLSNQIVVFIWGCSYTILYQWIIITGLKSSGSFEFNN